MDALAASGVLFERAFTPAPDDAARAHVDDDRPRRRPRTASAATAPSRSGRGRRRWRRRCGRAAWPPRPSSAASRWPGASGSRAASTHYDDAMAKSPGVSYEFAERRGDAVVEAARAWLSVHPGRVFVWVHLFDPHAPYDPPAGLPRARSLSRRGRGRGRRAGRPADGLERAARAVAGRARPPTTARPSASTARRATASSSTTPRCACLSSCAVRDGRRAGAWPPRRGSPTSPPPSSRRSGPAGRPCPAARCARSWTARRRSRSTPRRWPRGWTSDGATCAPGATGATSTSARRGPSSTTCRRIPARRATSPPRIRTSWPGCAAASTARSARLGEAESRRAPDAEAAERLRALGYVQGPQAQGSGADPKDMVDVALHHRARGRAPSAITPRPPPPIAPSPSATPRIRS